MKKQLKMRKTFFYILILFTGFLGYAQNSQEAEKILDEVSSKMTSYKNIQIDFESSLVHKEAGINENDEAPLKGIITLEGEKYKLNYLGNDFVFDGSNLYVINHDEQEITTADQNDDDEGFIHPSKIFTFYKDGFTYKLGKTASINGNKIQFITLTPIDSNSEIVKVELGVNTKTKHIYNLSQYGANGAITTFTIKNSITNKTLPTSTFRVNTEELKKKGYIID